MRIDPDLIQPHPQAIQNDSTLHISAVCISKNPETWSLSKFPFHNYTQGWKPFKHEKTKERVSYLAERRNKAVAQTLELFPETEHILMIDSYYLHQDERIVGLMREYESVTSLESSQGCILGASTWILDKTRVFARLRFYDGWTTPEATELDIREVEKGGGLMKVKAVGSCYLFPRVVWERTPYDVPIDLHGCEHNWLCEHSGLQSFLSLNQRLWREPVVYSPLKRIRMSLHLGRLRGE